MKQVIGIATTTCPDEQTASRIVESLLAESLIACGQIEGPIESAYFWKGVLCKESEWRILLKFAPKQARQLETRLTELHPYENPQWTHWKATASDEFGKWVRDLN